MSLTLEGLSVLIGVKQLLYLTRKQLVLRVCGNGTDVLS